MKPLQNCSARDPVRIFFSLPIALHLVAHQSWHSLRLMSGECNLYLSLASVGTSGIIFFILYPLGMQVFAALFRIFQKCMMRLKLQLTTVCFLVLSKVAPFITCPTFDRFWLWTKLFLTDATDTYLLRSRTWIGLNTKHYQ